VASFPNVISAHDIARAVLDEQIDRQQGFVTKEDCCRYVDAILRNLGEDNG
jgi:hypothetical protein